jgi:hypothetical protein
MEINATTSLTDNTAAQAEMLAFFACVQGQNRPTPARATFTTHDAHSEIAVLWSTHTKQL